MQPLHDEADVILEESTEEVGGSVGWHKLDEVFIVDTILCKANLAAPKQVVALRDSPAMLKIRIPGVTMIAVQVVVHAPVAIVKDMKCTGGSVGATVGP